MVLIGFGGDLRQCLVAIVRVKKFFVVREMLDQYHKHLEVKLSFSLTYPARQTRR